MLKEPEHMGPPETLPGAVGISFRVGIGVVNPMPRHPVNDASLRSKDAAKGKQILQPFGCSEGTVGQKPVITQANPDPAREPGENDEKKESGPRKGKGGRQSTEVHSCNPDNDPNIILFFGVLPALPCLSLFHAEAPLFKKNPGPAFFITGVAFWPGMSKHYSQFHPFGQCLFAAGDCPDCPNCPH